MSDALGAAAESRSEVFTAASLREDTLSGGNAETSGVKLSSGKPWLFGPLRKEEAMKLCAGRRPAAGRPRSGLAVVLTTSWLHVRMAWALGVGGRGGVSGGKNDDTPQQAGLM